MSMDPVAIAKALVKISQRIEIVGAILAQLRERRAALLRELGDT